MSRALHGVVDMNYCDYYLKVLSIYISTRAISPLDLVYLPNDRELYIWYPGVDDRSVVLYLHSSSWKWYPPVESIIGNEDTHFTFGYEGRITPPGYITEVKL
jgi:hypothetical protein